jgi:hydroxyethylthiazole kinase-like uncharacterized protein yjeF
MREWEKATWATGQTEAKVIRSVGQCLARHARDLTRPNDSILILAGRGHNGDDVRAAAEFLPSHGRRVTVLNVADPEKDLAAVEAALRGSAPDHPHGGRPDLVMDGLFGIGLNRPLDDAWQKLIGAVNAAKIQVLAADVPSGLNADTGDPLGAAVVAAVTVTIGAPKTGLVAAASWPFVGRLEVAGGGEVGLVPRPLRSELNWLLPEDFRSFPEPRPVEAHKGSFGHLAIIAGSLGFHGAAVLTARGAQRAQPGLITVYPRQEVYLPVACQLQAAMVNLWQADVKMPERLTALLIGPGLAAPGVPESIRLPLHHWWRDLDCPLVVDASALDFVSAGPFTRKPGRVMTPHPGEAGRLLNWPVARVQADRVAALRALSRKFSNCWVVLKGHQTLIGRGDGEIYVNSSGNPHLAQGGSGDLLAGFIAGLLAQPPLQADVVRTLCYAVWQHGAAADALQRTRRNWTVEDLAMELGNAHALPGQSA